MSQNVNFSVNQQINFQIDQQNIEPNNNVQANNVQPKYNPDPLSENVLKNIPEDKRERFSRSPELLMKQQSALKDDIKTDYQVLLDDHFDRLTEEQKKNPDTAPDDWKQRKTQLEAKRDQALQDIDSQYSEAIKTATKNKDAFTDYVLASGSDDLKVCAHGSTVLCGFQSARLED